ncbi:unannotated protein [freshwater metagenome]|uniref:Unannotated protein n=1 Tax=freshwater metagenome TaxID=449393 RepID=A0A6J7C4V5_9ZZZZ
MTGVNIGQFRGEQHLHLVAQQFRPRIAEQTFHLAIDQHDFAVGVDNDDAIRHRFHYFK